MCDADITELIANFSNAKSGWPWASVYFLSDCPSFPVNCSIYFLGSVSSSASTPASNGSSSNGLSFDGAAEGAGAGAGAAEGACDGAGAAGSVEPATFSLYFVSSVNFFFYY